MKRPRPAASETASERRKSAWFVLGTLLSRSHALVDPTEQSGTSRYEASTYYGVAMSKTYEVDSAYPQGCQCRQTGTPMSECTIFDCDCVCDLTAGSCDLNCCCDPECSVAEVSRFRQLGSCLPEGPPDRSVTSCYESVELAEVNPSFPLGIVSTSEKAMSELLCVHASNTGSKGAFLSDPGLPGATVFSQATGQKDFAYPSSLASSTEQATPDTVYDQGDLIPAAIADPSPRAAYGGHMALPAADADGVCNENNHVVFGSSRTTHCLRVVSHESFAEDCSDVFGAARFSSWLKVSPSPSLGPSPASTSYFNVTVDQVRYRDPVSLNETDVSGYNCNAFYSTSRTSSGSCAVGRTSASPYNNTGGYCRNAVVSVAYTATYSSGGSLLSVKADLVVTDLAVNVSGAGSLYTVAQRYSVAFVRAGTTERSAALGNLMNRTRSGNPGYLVGRPVLAGYKVGSGTGTSAAINALVSGLQTGLRTAADGSCLAPSLTSAGGTEDSVVVQFGVDMHAGCTVALSRSELRSMCTGGGAYMTSGRDVPTFLQLNTSYVGMYGNSDPLDFSQWLAVERSLGTATYSWDELAGVCRDFYTAVHYRFLAAALGAQDNPQNKIIAAQVEYAKKDLQFQEEARSLQLFEFSTTVSFVYMKDQTSADYTPPPPPVIFSVPSDVFYPFQIYSAAGTVGVSVARWAVIAWGGAAVVLLMGW